MVFRILCFAFILYPVQGNNRTKRGWNEKLPEEGMTVPQLIKYFGYPLKIHKVVTEDGYELSMHRIPYGRRTTAEQASRELNRPAVFLQHGLAASASCWIANLPEQSLAFILADSGFDVWLGNVRGNRYSKRNLNVSNWEEKFWDFSWEDMAKYDIPAMINHILSVINHQQVSYIGHSQGTLVAIAKFSEDQEFAKKIKLFIALAPVARVGHITSNIRKVALHKDEIHNIFTNIFREYSLKKLIEQMNGFEGLCKLSVFRSVFCDHIVSFVVGKEWKARLNESRIAVYLSNNPEDTSMKNLAHFAQMVNSGKMQKYNYGSLNRRIYGQDSPPEYNPENVNVPTVVFWSPIDKLTGEIDVDWLLSKLKNVIIASFRLDSYGHLDFVWSLNAREMIYDKIVELLKQQD